MSTSQSVSTSRWNEAGTAWNATAIAGAVRSQWLHPRRAVDEALLRIEERDPRLEAFARVRADAARAEADALSGRADLRYLPLAGVPVAVEEGFAIPGEPVRRGSTATEQAAQNLDHPVVRRLRDAGAIIVGLTRMPEFGLYPTTDSDQGITRNPWNQQLTAGGSNGGSAAALAAGMVVLGFGDDGLGSLRIPAAACGLVGIKPGSGVVPREPGENTWFGMAENGVLATGVADAALGLAVIADDASLTETAAPGQRLVIAASAASPIPGLRVDDAYQRALNSVATILARAGNEVRVAHPDYSPMATMSAVARWCAVAEQEVQSVDNPARTEARVRAQARLGRLVGKSSLTDESASRKFRESATQFLEAYDLLVTPALAKPPVAARRWSADSLFRTITGTLAWTPFTAAWSVLGAPAIVVPTGKLHPRTRTPLAVQIVARPGREQLLLAVAAQLQSFRPWQPLAPDYRPSDT